MKVCPKCGEDKDDMEFGYSGMTADRLQMICKQCRGIAVEAPVVEAPVVEAPVVEAPVDTSTAAVIPAEEVTPVEFPHDEA